MTWKCGAIEGTTVDRDAFARSVTDRRHLGMNRATEFYKVHNFGIRDRVVGFLFEEQLADCICVHNRLEPLGEMTPFLRRSNKSTRTSTLCSSFGSYPETKSRLSFVSPLQYVPSPGLGTSLQPIVTTSPDEPKIAAPTRRERSDDLRDADLAMYMPYSSCVGVTSLLPKSRFTKRRIISSQRMREVASIKTSPRGNASLTFCPW